MKPANNGAVLEQDRLPPEPVAGPARDRPAVVQDLAAALAVSAASGRPPRVLTGDRPTGDLHVGHLLGSLRNRVALQQAGAEVMIVIADYQVITDRDRPNGLAATVRSVVADYLAAGIDADRATIFPHSAVPELHQLMLPFLSLVSHAELVRNPTVKAELADSGRPLSGLLLTYPVHQAADILFCGADLVPVGHDQLPHLELTRVIARRFNDRYESIFAQPAALLAEVPLVLGTDGRKMSKSRGNAIVLGATDDETAIAVRRTVTDADRVISYDPQARPGIAGLLQIGAGLTGSTPERLATEIGAGGSAVLKNRVTEIINESLAPLRRRRRDLLAEPGLIDEVIIDGIATARGTAIATLTRVRRAMGMMLP